MFLGPIRSRQICLEASPGASSGSSRAVPDDELVCRAQHGSLSAHAELTDRYGPLAYRVALRLLGDPKDAQDLTREALAAAWQELPAFPEGSSYSAWLLQILIRRALSRTSPPPVTGPSGPPGNVASGSAPPAQESGAAVTVVAALPPPQRVAVVLHHFEGMSYDQVALITSSTVPAVRRHLFQARRMIVRAMHEWTSNRTVTYAGGA